MVRTTQSQELEKNKQLVSGFVEEVLTGHDIAAADKYFGKKPIKHNHEVLGIKGFKEARQKFFEEFPDSRTVIDHIIAEGDKVFAMLTTNATNGKTGKSISIRSADLYRIEGDAIAEHWDVVEAPETIQ